MNRELPEPAIKPSELIVPYGAGGGLFTTEQVLAIQKQAYEDGLRDAMKSCKQLETAIDGGGNVYYRPADARQCIYAIEAMLTASQKRDE